MNPNVDGCLYGTGDKAASAYIKLASCHLKVC